MKVQENVDLSKLSYWKIGGKAKYYVEVNSIDELNKAKCFANSKCVKILIIGNTTNLLFCDGTLDILLVKLGSGFSNILINNNIVEFGANVSCQKLVRKVHQNGLVGIEHIVGIPATLGGLIYMNGGSQRKTISEHLISVRTLSENGEIVERSTDECQFKYRKSIFQSLNNEMILSAKIKLFSGDKSLARKECLSILKGRNEKFPRKLPSCGSVFISDPKMYKTYGPPGKIIEELGYKGKVVGGACVSPKHANFIVNINNASSQDVLCLVKSINKSVYEKFGFQLESEGLFIDRKGNSTPLHLVEV